jgi:RNA polymerase sigma factor (sigma-70 family)
MTLSERLFPRGRPGLLARSRTSNRSFADFYETMAPSVLRYFARNIRDPHRAFDLTSETFAKAFEKRRDFRGASDEQAAAWLWSIARNELARFRRSRAIEFAAFARLALERPVLTDAELLRVEELAAGDQVREHVEQALALLLPAQREVIRLRFVEVLSYEEIAEQLGVSTDVVRARVSRALRTLRANDHVHQAVQALEL